MSFQDVQHRLIWILLDTVFYVIYILDVLLQMRTSYLRDGILEDDLQKVRMYYTNTWRFKVDVLSILPLDWLYTLLTMSHAPAALQIFRLLKIYRLRQFVDRTESRSHFPNLCRVLFLVHNVLVIIHWNACVYFLVSQWLGLGSDGWVYKASNETHNIEWGHLSRRYIYCFYWSTLTLTTIGELPEPQQNVEYVIVTLDYLIGILMFATLVGNIGSIIANMQKNRTKFQAKMDQIKHYMKETKVPNHLQERVIKWFDYLWTHGLPVEDQQALNALPDKLKAEIGIHVHFETLKKVDFFEECEQGLLWELVLRLRTQIYSPGEYVCRKGDVGREMYIVNSGRLEVSAEQNSEVFRKLLHGEYFGEISVLNLGKSQHRRTVFVRSIGYTQLLCLSQTDLLEVLNDYPRTKDTLVMKGKMKLENTSTVNKDPPRITTNDEEADLSTDSEDSSEVSSEFQLQTVADQVIDVHVRLSQMESLLKEIVHEIQKNGYNTRNPVSPMKRRISTQI